MENTISVFALNNYVFWVIFWLGGDPDLLKSESRVRHFSIILLRQLLYSLFINFGAKKQPKCHLSAGAWGQKTRTSHLLLYSQQLQAGIEGNLGRRQSPQISPSQDRFPTIGASAQLTHGGIS